MISVVFESKRQGGLQIVAVKTSSKEVIGINVFKAANQSIVWLIDFHFFGTPGTKYTANKP